MSGSVTLTDEVLLMYGTDYFVETGTFEGGAVQMAIEAGFADIRSCEIDIALFKKARDRFMNDPRVTLYWGDSVVKLSEMIEDICEPITFWLDAHVGNSETNGGMPLLQEIALIGEHNVKDHVLLIDDVRLMGKDIWWKEITKTRVINAILQINPRYVISYENSSIAKNDIMVARVPLESVE